MMKKTMMRKTVMKKTTMLMTTMRKSIRIPKAPAASQQPYPFIATKTR